MGQHNIASNGVLHNFEICTRRGAKPPKVQDMGLTGNIVLQLCLYSSILTCNVVILVLAHQETHCTDTVYDNRVPATT